MRNKLGVKTPTLSTDDVDVGSAEGAVTRDVGDLHRLLVDRVQDYAIFALDPRGCVLSWNTGAERLKGYSVDEIIGKHFSIFYPPDALAANKPAHELQIAEATGRVEDEGWRVRKDGSLFWANVLITALRDDHGTLVGFAKVTRDLTERRAAYEELRASEERFRLLVHSVRDYAIFMLDSTGHVATWNAGARRLKGYSEDEITGKHFSVFYPPSEAAAGKPDWELAIAADTGQYEEEGWRVRKDGTLFWANVLITAIRDKDGDILGFAKVTRDLTERRAAHEQALADARRVAVEEVARSAAEARADELRALTAQLRSQAVELERRSEEAQDANRVKSEFLAAMSHELRTPLNAIGGYAQLMQMELSGPLTTEQQQQLARIQSSQQHLLGIINDILNFSRIEAGQVTYDIKPVPIRGVLDAVIPLVMLQAEAKRIELVTASDSCDTTAVASADHAKVEQVLLNLLSNAVKFTLEGGQIELACGTTPDRVWLSVRDSGIGIPADQLDKIFEPFVQVGRSLASPKEGAGLGLAISRDLARAMHGDLTADSRVGVGSTFTLALPRAE
jgi:PAS domain S-box-containing protein